MHNNFSNNHNQLSSLVNMLLSKPEATQQKKNPSPKIRIPLSEPFHGQYLTLRESQCVYYAMQKMTIQETANQLSLSPRTVEFYLKRIRTKLNCTRKKELIDKLENANFKNRYKQYSNLHH